MLTGIWTPLANTVLVGSLDLLSDGTVITPRNGSTGGSSFKLIPDASGSYVNGTWSTAAGMSTGRQYSDQQILPDGRLLVLGGVMGVTNGVRLNTGVIYDPVANTFTSIASFPESTFGNGPTMLLADGRMLAGSTNGPQTYIYDPATNNWSAGPTKLYGDSNQHETWTKLPDGSILCYDVNSNPGEAQRLDQTTMTWIDSGSVPVSLEAGIGLGQNMGPGVLIPDGRVFQLGRSGNTAIYTPAATPGGTGTWQAGPLIPGGLESGGGSPGTETDQLYGGSTAALLPNGHVLFVADTPDTGGPTRFFEFDPSARRWRLHLPMSLRRSPPTRLFLKGSALEWSCCRLDRCCWELTQASIIPIISTRLTAAPQAAWKPTISSIVVATATLTH